MSAFDKLGMVAALVASLLTAYVDVSAATTATFSPVVNTIGDLSSLPHQGSLLEKMRQALRLATNELELARKLTELANEVCLDPAFLAYMSSLTPILNAVQVTRTLDASPIFALAYGLIGARSRLETDIASLQNWLLIQEIVKPGEHLLAPPKRFVAISTSPLLDEAEELPNADLTPETWG